MCCEGAVHHDVHNVVFESPLWADDTTAPRESSTEVIHLGGRGRQYGTLVVTDQEATAKGDSQRRQPKATAKGDSENWFDCVVILAIPSGGRCSVRPHGSARSTLTRHRTRHTQLSEGMFRHKKHGQDAKKTALEPATYIYKRNEQFERDAKDFAKKATHFKSAHDAQKERTLKKRQRVDSNEEMSAASPSLTQDEQAEEDAATEPSQWDRRGPKALQDEELRLKLIKTIRTHLPEISANHHAIHRRLNSFAQARFGRDVYSYATLNKVLTGTHAAKGGLKPEQCQIFEEFIQHLEGSVAGDVNVARHLEKSAAGDVVSAEKTVPV